MSDCLCLAQSCRGCTLSTVSPLLWSNIKNAVCLLSRTPYRTPLCAFLHRWTSSPHLRQQQRRRSTQLIIAAPSSWARRLKLGRISFVFAEVTQVSESLWQEVVAGSWKTFMEIETLGWETAVSCLDLSWIILFFFFVPKCPSNCLSLFHQPDLTGTLWFSWIKNYICRVQYQDIVMFNILSSKYLLQVLYIK